MSETSQVPVGTEEATVSDDLQNQAKEDTVQYSTYKKLLGEKKSRDEANALLSAKLQEFEQKDEQSKGNFEKVISDLREENSNLKGSIAQRDEAYLMSQVNSAIKSKALELGCTNPDKLLRLLDRKKVENLEVDSDYQVSSRDLEFLVNEGKKENDFLFKKTKANIVDDVPVGEPIVALPKSLKKMSQTELEDAIRKAHLQGS